MIFWKRESPKIITKPNLLQLKRKFSSVWKNDNFPERQWHRIERQLTNIKNVPEFRAIVGCIKATKLKNPTILEIGCSSGYLSEVLSRAGIKIRYEGTDYSPAFINFAKCKYPKIKFSINDAAKLNYSDKSFDIVVSGCCLLHVLDYKKAIAESARVAKKFVVFHRTPILLSGSTTYLTKTAYGEEMLEIHFDEEELADLFLKNKLAIIKIITIGDANENMVVKNYVCIKLS